MFLSRITQTVILSLCLLLSTPMTMYSASFYSGNNSIESMFVIVCALALIGGIVLGFIVADMTAPQNNLQQDRQEDITMRAQIVLDDFLQQYNISPDSVYRQEQPPVNYVDVTFKPNDPFKVILLGGTPERISRNLYLVISRPQFQGQQNQCLQLIELQSSDNKP